MHFSASFVLAALPFLALGQPTKLTRRHANEYVFTLTSISSGNQDVHYQSVVAQAGGLFIGGGILSPTVFDINDATTNLLLDSQAPIRPLVSLSTDGTLVWSPDSDSAAPNAISTGFSLTDAVEGDVVRSLLLNGNSSWLACPVDHAPGAYRVFSASNASTGPQGPCISIALAASSYTGDLPASYA